MKQTLILLFFFVFQNVSGQVENTSNQTFGKNGIFGVEIKQKLSEYYINERRISLLNYEIENKTQETIYFWFSKENLRNLSDSVIICNYFKKRTGDGSLSQIALDFNIELFVPGIFISFLKKIQQGKCFTIQIFSKDKDLDTARIQTFIKDHIIIFKSRQISKYVPIENFNQIVFFKDDFLVLDMEDL